MPVAAAVSRLAQTRGANVAVRTPAEEWTYRRLDERTGRMAAALRCRGLAPGDRCATLLSDPLGLLVTLLACDRIGATPVVLDPCWPSALRDSALEESEPRVVVDQDLPTAPATSTEPRRHRSGSALAVFTSGSTGRPCAIVRSTASWQRSFAPFSRLSRIGGGSTVLIPGPLTSTLFLFGAAHALASGAEVVLDSTATRLPWTAAHVVPTMLVDLAAAPYDLTGRTAVAAGAGLPPALARELTDWGVDLVGYYGAAELSLVAAGRGRLDPFPGVEVQIRGLRGEIWVRSDYLATGYLGRTTGPFRRDADGFATVGDLGRLTPETGLEVHGRSTGLVLTGGSAVLPEEVEATLRQLPGVREVTVLGVPHARLGQVVTAVVEADPSGLPDLATLRAWSARRLTPAQRPRRWYALARLPRTAGGKVSRSQLESGLADGSLRALRLR